MFDQEGKGFIAEEDLITKFEEFELEVDARLIL